MRNTINHAPDYTYKALASQFPAREKIPDLTHRPETAYDRRTIVEGSGQALTHDPSSPRAGPITCIDIFLPVLGVWYAANRVTTDSLG
jgi:hypothetical protein